MKKAIVLLLSLLMVLSLAACGSQAAPEESGATDKETEAATQAIVETAPTEELTEPAETAAPTQPETEAPAFDAGWAGDAYTMPIPQPPFNEFIISGEGDYQILSSNEQEIAELSRQDIIAYCNLLKELGFTIDLHEAEVTEGDDAGYQFEAKNAEGVYCYVAFMESRQAVYILIETE